MVVVHRRKRRDVKLRIELVMSHSVKSYARIPWLCDDRTAASENSPRESPGGLHPCMNSRLRDKRSNVSSAGNMVAVHRVRNHLTTGPATLNSSLQPSQAIPSQSRQATERRDVLR